VHDLLTGSSAYPPRPHLEKALKKSDKYRDIDTGGIGPTGFDLRGFLQKDADKYEAQRLRLISFDKLAHDTLEPLRIVIDYDELPEHKHSVHADAIKTLREEGISSS